MPPRSNEAITRRPPATSDNDATEATAAAATVTSDARDISTTTTTSQQRQQQQQRRRQRADKQKDAVGGRRRDGPQAAALVNNKADSAATAATQQRKQVKKQLKTNKKLVKQTTAPSSTPSPSASDAGGQQAAPASSPSSPSLGRVLSADSAHAPAFGRAAPALNDGPPSIVQRALGELKLGDHLIAAALAIGPALLLVLAILLACWYVRAKKREAKRLKAERKAAKRKHLKAKLNPFSRQATIGFVSGGKILGKALGAGNASSQASDKTKLGATRWDTIDSMDVDGTFNASSNNDSADCASTNSKLKTRKLARMLHRQSKTTSAYDSSSMDERLEDAGAQRRGDSNADEASAPKSLGRLRYALCYDFERSVLQVRVLEAAELPCMDLCGSSDPFVRVHLTPSSGSANLDPKQAHKYKWSEKTRVHKRTLNPVFNETFEFEVNYAELLTHKLMLQVYDYDRFSKHDAIGQVCVPMAGVDWSQSHDDWTELERIYDGTHMGDQLGELSISLRYVPTAGKLTVNVLEARKLKRMDLAGLSDPYVKLALMNAGKRLKKKKTSIKKCTLNPRFNESFTFELPFEQVRNVQLVLTVVDYDRIGTSEPIGKIVLGYEATTGEQEQRHWLDMIASPRRTIEQWHTLKSIDAVACISAPIDAPSHKSARDTMPY